MLSLWFWLEHWFLDVPGFWALLGRMMATAFVAVIAIFAVGLMLDLSGEVVVPCILVVVIGLSAWTGWAANRIGVRYRERRLGLSASAKRSKAEIRKGSQG